MITQSSNKDFSQLFDQALKNRSQLIETLHSEGTNAYRLFHGAGEGIPGLTIDRYGQLILAQTFRDPLSPSDLQRVQDAVNTRLHLPFAYNHRGKTATQGFEEWHQPSADALDEIQCTEFGSQFLIRARHPGIDPWLFLDLRAGRRYVRKHAPDLSLLNLFCYTGSIGISAAASGASEVWNVDFSGSNLAVAKRNATLNDLSEPQFQTIQEDCIPVMRQLAGLPVGGRRSQKLRYQRFNSRQFDLVFLDPPAWAKSPFGAIDVARDYPSLFKAAVLSAKPAGGRVIATNHVASVALEDWLNLLKRCAEKAGNPLKSVEVLTPELDFPSFDGRHPLKIAVCTLA